MYSFATVLHESWTICLYNFFDFSLILNSISHMNSEYTINSEKTNTAFTNT